MKKLLLAIGVFALTQTADAQVGVGITSPDASSILELSSTAKGFLPPRMTAAQRNAIATPANGLLVFQTDGAAGLYYNAGTPAAKDWRTVGTGVYTGITVYTPATGTNNYTIPLSAIGGVIIFDFNSNGSSMTLNATLPSPATAGNGTRIRFSYNRLGNTYHVNCTTPSGVIYPASGLVSATVTCYISSELVSDGTNWREVPAT